MRSKTKFPLSADKRNETVRYYQMPVPRLIIFDFDGVIADSETLACAVLADIISELGHPITTDDAIRLFTGLRSQECHTAIETMIGRPLPPDFVSILRNRRSASFERELTAVEGVRDYIRAFASTPQCIASQSSLEYLAFCLKILGLTESFQDAVFSAAGMKRGKPHPDIYLHAAKKMGVDPARAIVVEDSVIGVKAGVAAGATVIGLLAGSHIQSGHEQRLREAGAHHIARTFAEATDVTRSLFA